MNVDFNKKIKRFLSDYTECVLYRWNKPVMKMTRHLLIMKPDLH